MRIRGFRSARSVSFSPAAICALVGGPSVGKSNVLSAVWRLLQQGSPAPETEDLSSGATGEIELSATLGGGDEIRVQASPPGSARGSGREVPVLFLPASDRSGSLLAGPISDPHAVEVARKYLAVPSGASSTVPSAVLVAGLERLCEAGEHGIALLIEEPELFLRPQAQRYLYRLLRAFAENGNQVLYSTHEPAFLNVGRLEELALVEHSPRSGTTIVQPHPLGADESFRIVSEIDAERGELLLARAVLLVEGRTEKLSFPFIFAALGHDVDREAITIVDCGGKPNMRLFIRICHAARVPCVAVFDRDAAPGRRPSRSQGLLNREIVELAGAERTVVLAPDFEAAAGLKSHRHKPERAWQRFSSPGSEGVPRPLADAVRKTMALARA